MTRLRSLALVTLLWAAIYLPGLGSLELKGEEGRRIMPAVTMIESGNWIVPFLGGKPYLRKPPLMHWIIAASFQVSGARNGWTARMPSALSVLLLAATIVWTASGWMGVESALIAAIFSMTNIGLLEKGRLAEIEAVYIALTGGALVCWLAWRQQERSRWLVWLAPFVLLGLAMLTKGPPCLLFFYAVAAVVLWREKRLREFASLPHGVGLLIMTGMFAAWAVPYFQAQPDAIDVWAKESSHRFGVDEAFVVKAWLLGLPRGLGNFLPWLVLLPLLWSEKVLARLAVRDAELVRALRWPLVILFFALVLVPGVLPRYTLPMLAPACLLLALVLHEDAPPVQERVVPIWKNVCVGALMIVAVAAVAAIIFNRSVAAPAVGVLAICGLVLKRCAVLNRPLNLALCTAVIVSCGASVYATAIVPRMQAVDDVRPVGEFLNRNVADGARVYAFDLRFLHSFGAYHPALFYLRRPVTCVPEISDLPPEAEYIFTRVESVEKVRALNRAAQVVGEIRTKRGRNLVLLKLQPPRVK